MLGTVLLWLAASWLIAERHFGQRSKETIAAERKLATQQASYLAASVGRNLSSLSGIPDLLGTTEIVRKALALPAIQAAGPVAARKQRWTSQPVLLELDRHLAQVKRSLQVDLAYILNQRGDCIAASNWGGSDSLVGENYSEREYFAAALRGQRGMQYAFGRTTRTPGLYFSSPVLIAGKLAGVAVVKINMSSLSYLVMQSEGFVSDRHGVIILARDRSQELTALPDAPVQRLSPELRRQLYQREEIAPAALSAGEEGLLHLPGKPFPLVIAEASMPEYGLTLHVGAELPLLEAFERERLGLFLLSALLGGGLILAAGAVMHYVRSMRQTNRMLRDNAEKLHLTAKVFEHTQEGIIITDAQGAVIDVNQAFSKITGYAREEILGRNPRVLQSSHHDAEFYRRMWRAIAGRGFWSGEIWNRNKAGESFPEWLTISSMKNETGQVTHYVGVFSDISLIKQHEKQLEHIAHYDALTGIPNRVLLADRMRQAIAHSNRNRTVFAVCYLDLDGFKQVNDTMGHEAGDRVLVEVTRRIKEVIRGDDTVARLGGDEFVVLLVGMNAVDECFGSLDRLLDAISHPMEIYGKPVALGASIGVTLYRNDGQDIDTLLRYADQAMYVAKQSGKNQYHLYDAEHDQRTRAHHDHLRRIRQGLAQDEFVLHYQPKVDMRSREVMGAEALIRWRHPDRGLLPPSDFLGLIEGSELEIELGEWVISAALAQMERWRQSGLQLSVSINISGRHLQSADFAWKLKRKLLRYPDLPPGCLQIEVLETAALEDIQTVREVIEACRKFGVSFALDDFGTGYSSLSYLGSLPVDVLKIDQSFVRHMLQDKGSHAIVQGVIALSKAFDRQIVAEGVETGELFDALLQLGCEFGQGYGIARPMPADDLPLWRARWTAGR